MKISDCMTKKVRVANPEQTLQDAARTMADIDSGILPVGENNRLVGMITDRDIALRGIGAGKGPNAKIREIMSGEIKYCFEDDDTEEVLQNMGNVQLRRLPVLDHDKHLVGIVSLGDLAESASHKAGVALSEISRTSGLHSQSH